MIKCLIIEDNIDDVYLIERFLRKAKIEINLTRIETEKELRESLSKQDWDIVLSDYTLPDLDGFLVLEIMIEHNLDIPVIIVSGTINSIQAVDLMKKGAKDYILKNELTRLPVAIEREITEALVRNNEKMAQQKIMDNENRLSIVFENMKKGVAVLKYNGSKECWAIKEINPVATMILKRFGLNRKDSSQKECSGLCKILEVNFNEITADGKILQKLLTIQENDETISWITYDVSKLPNGEILLFLDDITETKLYESKMEHNLQEKEMMLHEIHHRVRNTLQIIMSFVRMKSRKIHDEYHLRKFNEISDQVRAMTLVYQQLYESDDMVYVDMNRYINSLAEDLLTDWEKRNKIHLKTDVESIRIDVEKVIPVGLIINELITNSIYHAFDYEADSKNIISIDLKKINENHVTLRYQDNGFGMSEKQLKSNEQLGIEMLSLLAIKQLHGIIEVHNEKGFGLSITFDPKPDKMTGRFRPGL